MLCASVLAELEATVPACNRVLPPSEDVASAVSATSTASGDRSVGKPKDFSGLADGTTNAYNSLEKWIVAALHKLGKDKTDLLLPTFEPNDALCSQIHGVIAEWHTTRTTARDAGVFDSRASELEKPPTSGLPRQIPRLDSPLHQPSSR